MVLTNHKNLKYYREPHHINRHIACYVQHLQDYNFVIKHIPGDTNKANALSQCPDYDTGVNDNSDVTVLPPHLFIQSTTLVCLFTRATTLSSINEHVQAHQLKQLPLLNQWATTYPLKQEGELFWYGDWLVVVENASLRRGVIFTLPWLTNCWTPQYLQHHMGSHPWLLVASPEEGCDWVHPRVHHMSITYKPTKQSKITPFPTIFRNLCYPFHINSHGVYC